jgi:hypothetical protein
MRLEEIVRIVVAESDGMLKVDWVWENFVVVRGRLFWGDAEPGWVSDNDGRRELLTPNLDFDARVMLFEHIGHRPLSCLFFPESLRELEECLLSEAGYFNGFTTFMCALVDGEARRFQCFYRDADGREHLFDKKTQHGFGMLENRGLRWL